MNVSTNRQIVLALLASVSGCNQEPYLDIVEIPIVLTFASEKDKAKYEQSFLENIDFANEIFYDSGLEFFVESESLVLSYDTSYTNSDLEVDNKVFYDYYPPNKIPIFVMDSIHTQSGVEFHGATKKTKTDFCNRFILMNKNNVAHNNPLLPHELGHVFGLAHVDEPTNLMNQNVDVGDVRLTTAQNERASLEANVFYYDCILD